MLATIKSSLALKVATAAAATAAAGGALTATDAVDLSTLFQGSGTAGIEADADAGVDANIGVDGSIGADAGTDSNLGDAAVNGGLDLGLELG